MMMMMTDSLELYCRERRGCDIRSGGPWNYVQVEYSHSPRVDAQSYDQYAQQVDEKTNGRL